ncbi:MAG: oxidoreductase, partial [Sediminibacterium sp.]|nr:oxidoreductase [Sediminibacterium sp.]
VQNYKIVFIHTFMQMTVTKSALVLGATGLTGSHLLALLLNSERYHAVTIYTRKPSGISHSRLKEILVDYDSWEQAVPADDVFCCLGTTIKQAKTKEAFTKVDLTYPVKIAGLQYAAGSRKFLVVSALGSSPSSVIFYSRTKGLKEEALKGIGYLSLVNFRPAIITGDRKERRTGEGIGLFIFNLISPLLLGPLKKYKPVPALAIARAMLHAAQDNSQGVRVVLSDEIKSFG